MLEIMYALLFFVGAIVPDTYKWIYYTTGLVALALVLENICLADIKHSTALGGNIRPLYRILGPHIFILWILYPIYWGVSEGGNVIPPDSEQVFYGILDILSKPVFGFLLLLGHTQIDITELDLRLYDRMDKEKAFNEKEQIHGGTVASPEPATNSEAA
ncbi:hypothetical protein B7463_g10387, partial [Scytalidium lignicola]